MSSPTTQIRYRLLVIKLGTNVLTGGTDQLDVGAMASVVDQIVRLREAGAKIVLVTSGAIAAGRQALGTVRRQSRSVGNLQVLAAVGQGRLMQAYDGFFARHGVTVAQALLTRSDLKSKRAAGNAKRALVGLLEIGVVPIVNENDVVATEEIGATFGDNDNLSATVANLIGADLLILVTDQDGLYERDPRGNPAARLIPRVERVSDDLIKAAESLPGERGRGGMESKLRAAAEATSWGSAVVIAGLARSDALIRIARGETEGTFFEPWGSRRSASRRRSLGSSFVAGTIVVDNGAAGALKTGRSSLLPVGVKEVRGSFQEGDIVEVVDTHGVAIARGAVAYSSDLIERVKGFRSPQAREVLSDSGTTSEEVVHLENLALL
jgi:glutamate 5-kinase